MNLEERSTESSGRDVALLFGGGFAAFLALNVLTMTLLDGPTYLAAFAVVWVVLMLVHTLVRRAWRDNFLVSVAAALVLAGVAASRYVWGIQHGLRRWNFLVLMTLIGCATFFLRESHLDDWFDRSDRWGSGGSGGCGSGGCGGGGCGGGGCGGCGS
jgi:uncharacterized membrane protein YgcG